MLTQPGKIVNSGVPHKKGTVVAVMYTQRDVLYQNCTIFIQQVWISVCRVIFRFPYDMMCSVVACR